MPTMNKPLGGVEDHARPDEVKTHTAVVEVKDAAAGRVVARIAQLGVIDHDGDWTEPGAFGTGQQVKISAYGHDVVARDAQPVGIGTIRELDGWAVADLTYNLRDQRGVAAFELVKMTADEGHTQEWSYGFRILDADRDTRGGQPVRVLKALNVFEVSPVTMGAGIGTHTVAAKDSDDGGLRLADHHDEALRLVGGLTERSLALAALRAKDGRVLSAANRERLTLVADGLRSHLDAIDGLLTDSTPPPPPDTAADAGGEGADVDADLGAGLAVEQLRHIRSQVEAANTDPEEG